MFFELNIELKKIGIRIKILCRIIELISFVDEGELMERENSINSSKIFSRLQNFTLLLFLVYIIFLVFVYYNWPIVQTFFMYFDSESPLSTLLRNIISSAILQPDKVDTVAIIAIVISFFYLAQKIKEEGHVFFDSEGVEAKYFKSLFIIMNNISYILLPFGYYLLVSPRYLELGALVIIVLFNNVIGLNLLTDWVNITQNYERLRNFKTTESIYQQKRDVIASAIIFVILFLAIIFIFILKFNLISIVYIEISLFVEYFIFCSVTFNIEGPLNIFLNDNVTIIKDVFIFENSPHKDYLFIIQENNVRTKIMKSSILYQRPSEQSTSTEN